MSISTNLHGRLRNTSLPVSNGLLPIFEAVANAIHAVEDAVIPFEAGRIDVRIVRDGQTEAEDEKRSGRDPLNNIVGFEIHDNGVGFTDVNMESFLTLDSEYKAERGGRGVGRLLWLKAFDVAEIDSVYLAEDQTLKRRTFTFNTRSGVSNEEVIESVANERHTIVKLIGFDKKYRNAAPKGASVIARNLFEHCLWYFIRPGGAPKIRVLDDSETIDLDTVYEEQMLAGATSETIDIKDARFELIHVRLSALSTRTHSLAFCADNRAVEPEPIKGKISGLHGNLMDNDREFVYQCYVSSPFLNEHVRSERTSFDIAEEPTELFGELSQKEIREAVLARAAAYLGDFLEEKRKLGKARVESFVAHKAPRYRPILGYVPEDQLSVDPDMSDKDLELHLHRQLMEIESRLLSEGHDIMKPQTDESYQQYSERLESYLKTAEDIKKSDLANYVFHRRIILDLLEKAIQIQEDGKYARESLIHNLIMPMGMTSNEIHFDTCNLWLIDERLAFHDFLASDKTLASMPITDSEETKEPDIIALHVFDNPILVSDSPKLPLASLVVVELKKPMRNDAKAGEEKDPVEQALGYLERIRNGQTTTQSGRPIPKSEDIPGFCYAICDITPSIEKRCKLLGLTPTHDHMGYFGYNPNYRAYIEVISFDRLVNAAKERNKAFFDKLGLPTT